METFFGNSPVIWAASALAATGVAAFFRGLGCLRHARRLRDPHRALGVARGIRLGIFGLCAVALAVGWAFAIDWVVFLALIILGEEMLEATVVIAALRDGVRMRDAEPLGTFAPALAPSWALGSAEDVRARAVFDHATSRPPRPAPRGRLAPRPFVVRYGQTRTRPSIVSA